MKIKNNFSFSNTFYILEEDLSSVMQFLRSYTQFSAIKPQKILELSYGETILIMKITPLRSKIQK